MRERFERGLVWIDSRSLRERVLLMLSALAVPYTLWALLLMDPLDAERAAIGMELEESAQRFEVLALQSRALGVKLSDSPESAELKRIERLEADIHELDDRLAAQRVSLVSTEEMVRVLEDLLGRESRLDLVRLETLPAKPIVFDEGVLEVAEPAPITLYRHDVVIELEGSYFAALRYLRSVEELPWRIYRDGLHYVVSEYPTARITLRVHTLSFDEAWIGV